MTLEEMIVKAIPADTCPQKNAHAMYRRKELRKRLDEYISKNYEPIKHEGGNRVDGYLREVLPVRSGDSG